VVVDATATGAPSLAAGAGPPAAAGGIRRLDDADLFASTRRASSRSSTSLEGHRGGGIGSSGFMRPTRLASSPPSTVPFSFSSPLAPSPSAATLPFSESACPFPSSTAAAPPPPGPDFLEG
ncbi:unnamed protein product, partial [Ectocarpus sp. 8 AP-2014]